MDPMEVLIEDNARAVLAAVQAELGPDDPINATHKDGAAKARIIYLVPGESIVWDIEGDCFGQLTARLASLTPHSSYPNKPALLTPCSIDYWTATLEITLLRCAQTVTNSGTAPSAEKLSADGFLGVSDMAAMLRAFTKLDFVDNVTQWTPQGPNGGRFGNQWLLSFKIDATPCE